MKQIFINVLVAAGCIFFFGVTGFTQSIPKTDPKLTPNISGSNTSIGSVYSPNLFDGSANINIPIFKYGTGAGELGVSLAYNTKGVRVDQMASSSGIQWRLRAGGNIRRVMKDLPDEGFHTPSPVMPPPGEPLDPRVVGKFYLLQNNVPPGGTLIDFKDEESDDFVVSIGKLAFTFNIGKDGFVFTHPNSHVKIDFTLNGLVVDAFTHYFSNYLSIPYDQIGFRITDNEGNKYWFKNGGVNNQYLYNGKAEPDTLLVLPYISQWVISKVVLADGNQIKYTYRNSTISILDPLYKSFVAAESPNVAGHNIISKAVYASEHSLNYLTIDSIYYPNATNIKFVYATGPEILCRPHHRDILKEIKISSGDNCVRYKLDQVYKVAPFPNYPNIPSEFHLTNICNYNEDAQGNPIPNFNLHLRRFLKGIEIVSCDGSQSEPYYSFDYDPTPLPPRLSGSQDFYGYYNGEEVTEYGGQLTIPFHLALHGDQHYGVDRSEDINFKKAGVLTKVTNAFGGSVSFEFGEHNAGPAIGAYDIDGVPLGTNQDPLFVGRYANDGLCLKRIIESDPLTPGNYKQIVLTYYGGQMFIESGFYHYPALISQTGAIVQYAFTGIFVSPRQFINGSNHGYSMVKIESKDVGGSLLSKREITFTNFEDSFSNNKPKYLVVGGSKNFFEYPFTDKQYIKDWEIGLPLTITDYDQNNQVISKISNFYSFTLDTLTAMGKFENIHSLKAPLQYADINDGLVTVATDSYRPYTGHAKLIMSAKNLYSAANRSLKDTILYTYDTRNNLKAVTSKNSKGEKILINNIYNYEVSGPDAYMGNQPGTTLYNMSVDGLEKVVSREGWKPVPGGNGLTDALLDANITGFSYANGILRIKNQFNLTIGTPVSFDDYTEPTSSSPSQNRYVEILTAYNTNDPVPYCRKMNEVELFDSKGNPLQIRILDQNMYKSILWDTLTMQTLAVAGNAKYNEIAYTGLEKKLFGSYTGNETIHSGRFYFKVSGLEFTERFTGKTSYQLSPSFTWMKTSGLTPNKEYIITCWAKNGVPKFSGAGAGTITLTETGVEPVNGWTFYKGRFTPNTSGEMSFSSTSTIFLDEIRLFPAGSQLHTWTYEPLYGPSSSTDASGRITHYEYDPFGRLTLVRDQEGNILSKTNYQVAQ